MKKDSNMNEGKNEIENHKKLTIENINKQTNDGENIDKNSPMMSIKNMFKLNIENTNPINRNNFSNSFYKSSQQSNKEDFHNNLSSLIPRTLSNNHLNNEKKYLNNKNFPSKANVCKGNPNSSQNYKYPNSSPIFQYYASNQRGVQDLGSSLENGNSLGCLGGRDSPQSVGFNYSPSEIFNNNGNAGSGFIKVRPEINNGNFFSIDSEADEDKIKNLDFKLPLDDVYNIKFDDGNFNVNFAEDKDIIVNKINDEIKKKNNENKKNQNENINNLNNIDNNIGDNINKNEELNKNINSFNDVCIEIKSNNAIKSENKINKEASSNLPIKKAMEKLRRKKSKEFNEISFDKTKINSYNNNEVNNTNNPEHIMYKSNDEEHLDSNQNLSSEFKMKFEAALDKMDDEHDFEVKNKENTLENNKKNEGQKIEDKPKILNTKNNDEINLNNIIDNQKKKEDNRLKDNNNKKIFINRNDDLIYLNNIENNIIKINENKHKNNSGINNELIQGINKKSDNKTLNNNYPLNINFNNTYNNIMNNNYNNSFLNNNNNTFNNNYNNLYSYSPLDYYINNNMKNYNKTQNLNPMMNNPFNLINNKNIITNNNDNYNNYQLPQVFNQFNLDNLNNNIPKFNQFLQNPRNINIQNNYFMYNNQDNLQNNKNQSKRNENKINEEGINEKPKKKKKKKQKRLESSSYMNKPLTYFAENFTTMAKDQGASRYLQQLLDNNPKEIIDILFVPLCKNALKLINDPFGNYLIQKIIIYLNQDQLLKILTIISPSFYEISCNSHGTRVLQKLIGRITNPIVKNYFFELVKPIVAPLLKDLNGTYIVQKFATQNINDYGLRINSIIIENATDLCTHRHGCCVIQKYLETKDQTILPGLLDKLIENSLLLIIDQFGNYVIQTILLMGDNNLGNKIAEKITSNVVFYAKHKYSSNVVEKCFDHCDGIYLKNLMNNVQKKENLVKLILDEHGNYVVQKVLSLSTSKKQKAMLSIIKSLFDKLKNLPYGERVINRIVSTYPFINNC